jgi:GT2 family glycosyltransferase
LQFFDRPLRVQKGDDALMMVMDLLEGSDRAGVATFILRVLSSLVGNLDAPLMLMVRDILRTHATEREARAYVLDGQHLYWRVALPKGLEHPAAVMVRCFFLHDQQLVQISCGKALRTPAGVLHMLSRRPSTAKEGSLVVVIGSLIVMAPVRRMPRHASLDALGAILSGQADDPLMIKRYLLSRCAELYRAHKAPEVLGLGNQVWAQTPFASQAVVRPDMDFGGAIERILPVPGKGLLIVGWLVDPHRLIDHFEVVDGQGRIGRLKAPVFRYDRPDVREIFPALSRKAPGFITFHPSKTVGHLWPTYQVKGVLKSGASIGFATDLKASQRSLVSAEAVLGLVPAETATAELYREIMPAVSYLQTRKAARPPRCFQFLSRVDEPDITVVVPIYRRLDHARHQLAQFAADASFASVELIYVLDAPELESEFASQLEAWCRLYQRPAMLAVMPRNRGFAAASNAGAQLGRGRFLVLLNSDVIPAAPGWARTMRQILEADGTIGATGARLLYEDGAVQHAGMEHICDSGGTWKVIHPGKGLRADLQSRFVPAVTAACMMMRSELYKSVGGLSEDYVIGDFEDSDLCLKIRAQGKSIWFCAEAVLYHLERQSMGVDGRYTPVMRRYNQVLHQNRWAAVLAKAQV